MAHDNQEPLWTINDAGTYLRIPVSSIYKMTARKARTRIPHIRIHGRLRFRKADLDAWLELLAVSNLGTLKRMQTAMQKVTRGHYSQEESGQR